MALTMVTLPLREGIYGPHSQWATTRKSRAWLKNLANSASGYLGNPLPREAGGSTRFKICSVTDKERCQRFCTGVKWRMGEVKFQN